MAAATRGGVIGQVGVEIHEHRAGKVTRQVGRATVRRHDSPAHVQQPDISQAVSEFGG
ncbi:Uncharacterised protein [Mycobacteroides abscessus]|nr:Uncharacterised protein [Mycobacteroides abscessus]CQA11911.1 Uncharacterised protein [Mycobacteroides abscessus]SKJ51092.1 Uncharacterised protein [Mycobacteroides abscessus subsp. massiliense]SKJ77822.1 Uncharacterised protein [Mycobacteroides abscessus subsp. massiliense]